MNRKPSQKQYPTPLRVLRVDSSARGTDSATRALGDRLEARLRREHGGELRVARRDLGRHPPAFLDTAWVDASFTPDEQRTDAQRRVLAASDALVEELRETDLLIVGAPIYNFSIPAALKAWIDMVARPRLTFRYTETGVEGLLKGKRACVITASGGVPVGSEIDFATGYLRHALAFLGITEVEIIAADRIKLQGSDAMSRAERQIDALVTRGTVADTAIAAA